MKTNRLFKTTNNGLFGAIQNVLNLEWFDSVKADKLNYEFFFYHSGERTLSNFVIKIAKMLDIDIEDESVDISVIYPYLAKVVETRYGNRWKRLYDTLTIEYNLSAIETTQSVETPDITKTNNTDKTTGNSSTSNSTISDTGSNQVDNSVKNVKDMTGTDKHEIAVSDHDTTATETRIEKNISNDDTDINVFGFNSTTSVPSSNSTHDASEITTADPAHNSVTREGGSTTSDTETRNMQDSTSIESTEKQQNTNTKTSEGTSTDTGTEKTENTATEKGTRTTDVTRTKGNITDEIMKELELRDNIIDNIIMKDLDELLTSPVYEY